MTKYIVHGGKPLFGEVEISGAKNAAVAIIPAAILVDGVCRQILLQGEALYWNVFEKSIRTKLAAK